MNTSSIGSIDTATLLKLDGVADLMSIQADVSLADHVVAEKQVPKKPEKKSSKVVDEPWEPNDFVKDAAWFSSNCALPIEGDNPHKISYVTEKELVACFGGKERNGYKLSNCVGIPVADVLALSQVIDGYDKPVNGVLSFTFAKGAYAERVLKRKVDWATYAATKLKGQIVQWERVGKGKPDKPPCVRKPRLYVSPFAKESIEPNVDLELSYEARMFPEIDLSTVSLNDDSTSIPVEVVVVEASPILETLMPTLSQRHTLPRERASTSIAVQHLLLSILKIEMSKMKNSEEEIRSHIDRVDQSYTKLLAFQKVVLSTETTLSEQVTCLESKVAETQNQLQAEETMLQDLATDIELELNKENDIGEIAEVNSELIGLLEKKQKSREDICERLKSQLEGTKKDLQSTHEVIA